MSPMLSIPTSAWGASITSSSLRWAAPTLAAAFALSALPVLRSPCHSFVHGLHPRAELVARARIEVPCSTRGTALVNLEAVRVLWCHDPGFLGGRGIPKLSNQGVIAKLYQTLLLAPLFSEVRQAITSELAVTELEVHPILGPPFHEPTFEHRQSLPAFSSTSGTSSISFPPAFIPAGVPAAAWSMVMFAPRVIVMR